MKIVVVSCLVVVLSVYLDALPASLDSIDKSKSIYSTINDVIHVAIHTINHTQITDFLLCDELKDPWTLYCGGNDVIQILAVNYGGQQHPDGAGCPHPTRDSNVTDCNGGRHKVMETCNNKKNCKLYFNNDFFGDSCWDIYKYLFVRFTCNLEEQGTRSATRRA